MSEQSEPVVRKINMGWIFLACHPCVCPSITSNSSLTLEARGLKSCIFTPHINAKSYRPDFWGGWDMGVFLGSRLAWRTLTWASIWGVGMQNFNPLTSKLRQETEVIEGGRTDGCKHLTFLWKIHCAQTQELIVYKKLRLIVK